MQRSLTDGATSEAVPGSKSWFATFSKISAWSAMGPERSRQDCPGEGRSQPPRLVGRRAEDPQAGAGRPDRNPHDLLADAAGRRGRRGARRSRRTGGGLWLRLPDRGGSIGRRGTHRHARDRDRYRIRRIHHRNSVRLFAQQADLGCGAHRRTRGGWQFRR